MSKQKSKEKSKEKSNEKSKNAEESKEDKEFRHLVRVCGVIVDGKLRINRALMKVKGIGPEVSNSVLPILNLPTGTKIGSLTDGEIEKIEVVIENLDKHIPGWMLNRQRDIETGKNRHLLTADLDMSLREDLNRMKKMRSYKGIRHSLNLPVRGQRTRSSFRHGATMGVSRKKK